MMDQSQSPRSRASFNRAMNRPASTPRKVNRKALILAVVLGAVAAILTALFLGNRGASSDQAVAEPTLQVVVAAREIKPGQKVTSSMVELREIPESAVLKSAATDVEQVVGQVARYPVQSGTQMGAFQLVQASEVQALSFQIPQGLRAFTIPVSVNNTPAALIAPGDFVDLLVSGTPDVLRQTPNLAVAEGLRGNSEGNATVTMLQNVQVLAVQRTYVDNGVTYDSSVRGEPDAKGAVSFLTLALTPEQGQLVSLIGTDGKITLSLRPFGDDGIVDLDPITSMRQVAIATKDLEAGQRITEDMVELKVLPETSIVHNAAGDLSQVLGQTLSTPIARGEQFSDLRAVELAENLALSFQIPDGMRAFTLPVDPNSSPAALTAPGDYVDLLMAITDEDGYVVHLETLYQNIRVLAVQRSVVAGAQPYGDAIRGELPKQGAAGNLTLALTPEQAQELWRLQIARNAAVTVTLRPYQDADIELLRPISEIVLP